MSAPPETICPLLATAMTIGNAIMAAADKPQAPQVPTCLGDRCAWYRASGVVDAKGNTTGRCAVAGTPAPQVNGIKP